MPREQRSYDPEVRDAAVRMVVEGRGPEESLKTVVQRVAPLVDVKFSTLYNWSKRATPLVDVTARKVVTVGDLESEVVALKRELREVRRANEILKAAATFFGAEIDRQSQR